MDLIKWILTGVVLVFLFCLWGGKLELLWQCTLTIGLVVVVVLIVGFSIGEIWNIDLSKWFV